MLAFKQAFQDPVQFRKFAIGAALIFLVVEFYYAVFLRVGDFEVHRAFGQNFIDGTPYFNHNAYMLPRMMFNAVPAGLNYYISRALFYFAAVAGLYYCLRTWMQMAQERFPLSTDDAFKATVIAVVIMFPLLLRDLDECGLQIFVLLLLTLSAQSLLEGKKTRSGFYLALAIGYKSTPLLFLPFLIWKRQWHVALALVGWFIVIALLPAVWLGWDGTIDAHLKWWHQVQNMLQSADAYPSFGYLEGPKHNNLSLRALIARFVETYPSGHPLYLDHPLFLQFGNLEPQTAKRVVYGGVFLLGTLIALCFCKPWQLERGRGDFAVEWAVACLFVALASPAAWRHHLIVGLPVMLLAVQSAMVAPRTTYRVAAVAIIAALILLTKQFLVGGELKIVLLSYKPDTFALLFAAALVMFAPKTRDSSD